MKLVAEVFLFLFGLTVGSHVTSFAFATNDVVYTKAVYSLPLTYDPVAMNDEASLLVSSLIYDGLLSFTPSLRLEGSLAESWSTDRSGKILTFKLRKDIKFHNGEVLTAATVIRSLERAVKPGSAVFKLYDCIEGAENYFSGKSKQVTGLRAVDDLTAEIKLKNPFPPFLSVLAGATAKILPLSVFSDKEFFKHPIGTGAFKFSAVTDSKTTPELALLRV